MLSWPCWRRTVSSKFLRPLHVSSLMTSQTGGLFHFPHIKSSWWISIIKQNPSLNLRSVYKMPKAAAVSQRILFLWHTSESDPVAHPGVDRCQYTKFILKSKIFVTVLKNVSETGPSLPICVAFSS